MHNAYSLYHRDHTTKAYDLLGWILKIVNELAWEISVLRPNKEISSFQVIGSRFGRLIFVFNYFFSGKKLKNILGFTS